jgi:multidrug resistance efflux pump
MLTGLNFLSELIFTYCSQLEIMRGRWASAALGAGVARRRAANEMDRQSEAYESQLQQSKQQIEAQQKQIESLKQKQPAQPKQEDITQKLVKYGELKQQGVLTEEEFQKLKADLLSKM